MRRINLPGSWLRWPAAETAKATTPPSRPHIRFRQHRYSRIHQRLITFAVPTHVDRDLQLAAVHAQRAELTTWPQASASVNLTRVR